MHMRTPNSFVLTLLALAAAFTLDSLANAEDTAIQLSQGTSDISPIGVIHSLRLTGFGTPPERQRVRVSIRDTVFRNKAMETVKNGAMRIRFGDATSLRIGSESLVVLDDYVYAPDNGGSKMTLRFSKGVFRFVTGKMNKQAYRIITPSATIGIRGTDFLATVTDDSTLIDVYEGEIDFEPRGGDDNQTVTVAAGQSVSVSAQSNTPTLGTAAAPADPALAEEIADEGDEEDDEELHAQDDDDDDDHDDDDDDHHDDEDHGDEGGEGGEGGDH